MMVKRTVPSCVSLCNKNIVVQMMRFSTDNFVRDPNTISYDETLDSSQQLPSVEVHLVVYIVDSVLVSGVEEIIRMKFVLYAVMELKNHCEELADYINTPNWNCPAFYDNNDEDDDEEYTISITPVLPTVEPDSSLNHSEIFVDPNDDYASSDDDPLYNEDIDYVDASPPDSELANLEEVKDFDTEGGEIDPDNLQTIKDDILMRHYEYTFLNAKNRKNSRQSHSSKSSGNPTSHSDLSLPDYEAFYYDNEPDSENFTIDVVEDIFDNPTRELYVHVPSLPHPSLPLSGFGLRSF
ncbi:hypothetical protein Tco_1317906 [Tanacetum coccineum]